MADCSHVVLRQAPYESAVRRCRQSYARTRDPSNLLELARYQTLDLKPQDAIETLKEIPGTFKEGEVALWLGHNYLALHRHQDAFAASRHALLVFEKDKSANDMARSYVAMSNLHWTRGELSDALDTSLSALKLARSEDTVSKAYLAKIAALRRMGRFEEAQDTIEIAKNLELSACSRQQVLLREAMLNDEHGKDSLALVVLKNLEADLSCQNGNYLVQLYSNLAWAYFDRGEDDLSIGYLDKVVDKAGEYDFDDRLLRALIEARHRRWDAAFRYLADAGRLKPYDADWKWELHRAYAEIEEMRGNDAAAEQRYWNAIDDVLFIRQEAPKAGEYFVASHRAPFEGLIGLWARQSRWEEVLAVIQLMDSSQMLNDGATPPSREDIELDSDAQKRRAVFHASLDLKRTAAIRDGWSKRSDLVIVIALAKRELEPEKERTYRILVQNGKVSGEDVGSAKDVRKWVDSMDSGDEDEEVAKKLSKVFVPSSKSSSTLAVIGVGELGKASLGALKEQDGALTTGQRALVRAFGLGAPTPPSKGDGLGAIVAAGAGGKLPFVEAEARAARAAMKAGGGLLRVKQSGAGSRTPATRAQLWQAANASVLYLAAHSGTGKSSREIQLDHDVVTVDDLREYKVSPRLAVLSMCGSATARDEEGRGSVASVLLQSGTEIVVATNSQIPDQATSVMMSAFVAQPDWLSAPQMALARVQSEVERVGQIDGVAIPRALAAAFVVIVRPPYLP